jgi:hypothetical protein
LFGVEAYDRPPAGKIYIARLHAPNLSRRLLYMGHAAGAIHPRHAERDLYRFGLFINDPVHSF